VTLHGDGTPAARRPSGTARDTIVDMFRKKDLEIRCARSVAKAVGGTAEPEHGEWPDAWIISSAGERTPAEVVSAFPEDDASAWAAAYAKGAAKARSVEGDLPPSWVVNRGQAIVLEPGTPMPVKTRPVDPVVGILRALELKTGKYEPAAAANAILIVHQVQWHSALEPERLRRVADHAARVGAPFRQVWIVNEYGDPAQKVPFGD
jgi:hypothetical protein